MGREFSNFRIHRTLTVPAFADQRRESCMHFKVPVEKRGVYHVLRRKSYIHFNVAAEKRGVYHDLRRESCMHVKVAAEKRAVYHDPRRESCMHARVTAEKRGVYLDVLVVQVEVVGLGALLEGVSGPDVLLAAERGHRDGPALLEANQVVGQSAVTVHLPRKSRRSALDSGCHWSAGLY